MKGKDLCLNYWLYVDFEYIDSNQAIVSFIYTQVSKFNLYLCYLQLLAIIYIAQQFSLSNKVRNKNVKHFIQVQSKIPTL